MAATNSTSNLGLPQWEATDKPERTDFNTAMSDIDNTVAAHLAETAAESIAFSRDASLTGTQIISLTNNKIPNNLTLIMVVTGSLRASFGTLAGCMYRVASPYEWRVGLMPEIGVIASTSANRTFCKLVELRQGEIEIEWTHSGTGSIGTIECRLVVLYHGN